MTSRLRRLASGRFMPSIETQQRREDFVCRSCSPVVEEKKKNYKFFSSNHLLRGEEHHRLDQLLNRFINHEQKGVPSKAGTDEDANDVFDMKRMRVFLKLLGDPHKGKTYKTIHVGGTKGKCILVMAAAKGGGPLGPKRLRWDRDHEVMVMTIIVVTMMMRASGVLNLGKTLVLCKVL
mgnify:CR=1 FL=1